jgi:hypothetical protein
MALTTLRKRTVRLGRVVAIDLPSSTGQYVVHFNRNKNGSKVRMTTPAGVKYYFSKEDIRALADQFASLAK